MEKSQEEEKQEEENQEEEKQKNQEKKSRRKKDHARRQKRIRNLCILVLLVILGAAGGRVFRNYALPTTIQARLDIQPDQNARDGVLKAEGRGPIDAGEYWVVLNQLPTMESGSRTCNLEFENPGENHYNSRITLYLKSTGSRIGGTRLVEPGKYVETVELSADLEAGEHPILAKLELFEGEEPVGGMTLEITIRVTSQTCPGQP